MPALSRLIRTGCILIPLLLAACTSMPDYESRLDNARTLAAARGWAPLPIQTDHLPLMAYVPGQSMRSDTLAIYIEGDGFAWISGSRPSFDPTPIDPIGLKLALAHPAGNATYLGRPCQYIDAEGLGCPSNLWLDGRFSETAVAATNQAVSELKRRFQATKLILIGYSGGGAIAALVAARRNDVAGLLTVAGNLDHAAWTREHRVTPLTGSLNPIDYADRLGDVPQIHFVGNNDKNITPVFSRNFIQRLGGHNIARLEVIDGFDHHCCWANEWPRLFRQYARP